MASSVSLSQTALHYPPYAFRICLNMPHSLDKGTFDAIALVPAPKDEPTAKHPTDVYPRRVESTLEPGGYFLITCEYPTSKPKLYLR